MLMLVVADECGGKGMVVRWCYMEGGDDGGDDSDVDSKWIVILNAGVVGKEWW